MSGMFDTVTDDGWTIPVGWKPSDGRNRDSQCRSCKAKVLWCDTPAGKRAPVNRDGTSHFATCPQANDWRKRP